MLGRVSFKVIFIILIVSSISFYSNPNPSLMIFQWCYAKTASFDSPKAYNELISALTEEYAYLDKYTGDKEALFEAYRDKFIQTTSREEFRDKAQQFLRIFSDPHLNLGPYNEHDYSVIPTGSDIWGIEKDGKYFVEDVKLGGAAEVSGVLPGDQIVSIDGLMVSSAIEAVYGKSLSALTLAQRTFGLNIALGGRRNKGRDLVLAFNGAKKNIHLPPSYEAIGKMSNGQTLSSKRIGSIGYIRFHNSLGREETVAEFKKHITMLSDTTALILDLRDIPSGGNTGVAEPLLGHFSKHKVAYQLFRTQSKGKSYAQSELKKAFVRPSKPHYNKPIIALVGRWTGSMGEGFAIGLEAIGAKAVIGAPMGQLLGGIKTVQLPTTQSWLELGFERLYHVNGTFRENYLPNPLIIPSDKDRDGRDPALQKALTKLKE